MTATPPKEKHPWKLVRNPSDSMKIAEHIATLQTEIDEARRREATAVKQHNALLREVHAWRKWRENSDAALWLHVVKARKETDRVGAFRCVPEDA
jgi:hypothetical protein